MEILIDALQTLLTPQHFFFLLLGVFVGTVVAILPGLGGTAGLSLVLPFIYGMDPASALALMIGLLAVTSTGDTFPSVLMGIPGSNASQATVVDGFPLAKQGKGAMALSAAFSASLIGGVFGAIVLTFGVFAARPLILATGMGEQLLLIILALTMVGLLTGRSMSKGLAACGIGLLIGTIGTAPATGELRYTFSTVYLSDGIPLVVVALAIFAVPEIVDLMRSQGAIAAKLGKGWRDGIRATLSHPWLVLRCSGLGCLMGALPGLGGSVIDWIAYGHVVQTSRDKSQFGKGDIRGVIAVESATNAKEGGALFPTLFFGIPGSGSMAVLLGGFVLIGVQPGIRMVTDDLNMTYLIVWSLAIANIIATVLCIAIAPQIAKLTTIRYSYIGPAVIVVIVFTAYQATRDWGDVLALAALSVLGIYMRRFAWPRPALIIGFVLSGVFEAAFYRTVQVYGWSFLERPQSLLILALIVISLVTGYRAMKAGMRDESEDLGPSTHRLPQIGFSLLMMAMVVYMLLAVLQTAPLSRVFPIAAASVTALLIVWTLYQQITRSLSDPVLMDAERSAQAVQRPPIFYYPCWFLVFIVLTWILGYSIGVGLFLMVFITLEVRGPIWRNLAIALGTVGLLAALSYALYLEYPPGLLPRYVNLPWWFG